MIRKIAPHGTDTGTPEDDESLIAFCKGAGAPPWIYEAEGWMGAYRSI